MLAEERRLREEALAEEGRLREEALAGQAAEHAAALAEEGRLREEALAEERRLRKEGIEGMQQQVDLIWPAAHHSYFQMQYEALASVLTSAHLLCRLANKSYNEATGTSKFESHLRFGSFCLQPYVPLAGAADAGPPAELEHARTTHSSVGQFLHDNANFGILAVAINAERETATLDIEERLREFVRDRNDAVHIGGGFLKRVGMEGTPDDEILSKMADHMVENAALLDGALACESGSDEARIEGARTVLAGVAATWRQLFELASLIRERILPRLP
ncbi:MAG: hypothetical protein Kilf2KO_49230 [Rhodospirillales bacterium]